ncbi:MAG: hypothetical protein OYH76_01110 [Defluviicoccus sp.]|nr:hypothetical protein [Defluviicoccus sp.]MDE0274462.1 hypothetical protein [Defluviicoccus sp.]
MPEKTLRPRASVAIYLGLAALGSTVGYLTGSSGPDSTVLAAVLPAVLSILGGGAAATVLVKQTTTRNDLLLASGIALIVFSTALLLATQPGANITALNKYSAFKRSLLATQQAHDDRLWLDLQHHHRRLEQCLKFEVQMNDNRDKLNLPPLTHEQICPSTLTPVRDTAKPE